MRRTVFAFLLMFLLGSTMLRAQAVSGTLSGRITTAEGAGVPNAAVTITNSETGVSQRVLTGPDGAFSAAGLPSGTYRMEVETAGFKRTTVREVQLVPPTPATINVSLVPGDIMETVEVMGTAPAVQTDNGEVNLGVSSRTVRELPILDRNHQQLAQLQTGVTPPTATVPMAVDPAQNRFFSTNGQRPVINMWQTDGMHNWEPFRGTAIRVQPVESIQQMNMTTGSSNAEKGFSGGMIANTMTRPGTNGWHGSLFEFHSNNELRSRPFFNNEPFEKPRFTYNQFGGTIGGAIVPDRTFIFGSYEGNYNRGRNSVLTTVPTAQMAAGNFSGIPGVQIFNPTTGDATGFGRQPFAGNVIPAGQLNSTALALARQIPAPNQPGFTNNYLYNAWRKNDWNKIDGRIDHRFGDRMSAFLRYGYSNLHTIDESVAGTTLGDVRTRLVAQTAAVNFTNTFTPSFISELRLGYNRYQQRMNQNLADSGFIGNVLGPQFGPSSSVQFINVPGLPALGNPLQYPMLGVDNNYNLVWNGSYRSSFHNFKFGTDIRRFRTDGFFNNLAYGPMGAANFYSGATLSPLAGGFGSLGGYPNAFAAFLVGSPSSISAVQFAETPTIRQTWYGFHLSDTIQYSRRLSFDVGVRYDLFSPLEPRREGGSMFFDPATNLLQFAGIGNNPMRGNARDWDYRNIAPRVSFAFQPIDRTVIRGGYAINYFQMPYQFTGFMPSAFAVGSAVNGSFQIAPGGFTPLNPNGFTGGAYPAAGITAPNIPVNVVSPDMETPYVQTMNLQLQQEFSQGFMLSVGYVGALGRHLPMVQELNVGQPGTGVAGLPYFGAFGRTASTSLYTSGDNSNYHAFQTMLTKRFGQGLSFQGAYTYGRVKGYTSGSEGRLLNPFDRKSNYGYLDWDREHTLTLNHVWELPFGAGTNRLNEGWVGHVIGNWQINGTFTWASGPPLTVTADPLFANSPNGLLFPNPVGPVNVNGSGFTGSFALPGAGQLGTLQRGAFRAEGYRNYDMSLFRSFPMMDRYKLEFRGEVYNIANTPRFVLPGTHIGSPGFGTQPTTLNSGFGRQFNLSARTLF
ncbi:MAG TPA: TonB-dependent receptor [Bryobacteraceae bacterium]|nr:TonB-dependent receptor [Bryobacteraceae bacterium]